MSLIDEHVVVLLTGISASGKSTVAELLASRFAHGVHVRGDVFRRMVRAGRADMTAEPSDAARRQLQLRYRIAAGVTDQYFDAGFSVVVQDIVLGPALARVCGHDPEPAAAGRGARAEHRSGQAARSRSRQTAYGGARHTAEDLDRALQEETPRIGLWIDSTDQTPDDTVAEIVRRPQTPRCRSSGPRSDTYHQRVPVSPYIKRIREAVGSDLILVPAVSTLALDYDGRVLARNELDQDRCWSAPGRSVPTSTSAPRTPPAARCSRRPASRCASTASSPCSAAPSCRTRYKNGDEVAYLSRPCYGGTVIGGRVAARRRRSDRGGVVHA